MLQRVGQSKFFTDADRSRNVVRTVAVDARSGLTSDDRYQTLQQKIRLGRLGRVFFCVRQFLSVTPCTTQRLAQNCRRAHPRHWKFVFFAIYTLWVFSKRHFHLLCPGNDHFIRRYPPELDAGAQTADHIARTGSGVDRRESGGPNLGYCNVIGVDAVTSADMRRDRICHFIFIRCCLHFRLAPERQVAVGIDEAGRDPASRRIDALCLCRNRQFRASHRRDFSV